MMESESASLNKYDNKDQEFDAGYLALIVHIQKKLIQLKNKGKMVE